MLITMLTSGIGDYEMSDERAFGGTHTFAVKTLWSEGQIITRRNNLLRLNPFGYSSLTQTRGETDLS